MWLVLLIVLLVLLFGGGGFWLGGPRGGGISLGGIILILIILWLLGAIPSYGGEVDQMARWNAARVDPRRSIELDKLVEKYQRLAPRYEKVQSMRANGVPAQVIFGLHMREADCSFTQSLAQGDRLTQKSIHVPKGRIPGKSPPYTWEQAAEDALYAPELDHMDAKNWSRMASVLQNVESYNGLGVQKYHPETVSSYLWGATTLYGATAGRIGKYSSDGKWDKRAVDSQVGVAAVLKRMKERGIILHFEQ